MTPNPYLSSLLWLLPILPLAGAAGNKDLFAPNAFIRIDKAGAITLIMPQVEMGQGIYTAIAMILAEELDAAYRDAPVEMVQLTLAAALVRPEVWPFALIYGVWLTGRSPRRAAVLVGCIVVVAGAWAVPELLHTGTGAVGAATGKATSSSARQISRKAAPPNGNWQTVAGQVWTCNVPAQPTPSSGAG